MTYVPLAGGGEDTVWDRECKGYHPAPVPSWLLKAAAQGAISVLPARHRLNAVLQQRVTGSLGLSDAGFMAKLRQCGHHLASFRDARGPGRLPRSALELGTGWYPIVPIGLALAGVEEVTTTDIAPLLDARRARRVLELFAAAIQRDELRSVLPEVDPSRAEAVLAGAGAHAAAPLEGLLARVGVRTTVGEARDLGFTAGSIELLVSNNTLEHVPPTALAEVLAELRRLCAANGVMDHFIDISDHYAHFDHSITEFNYLRYPARAWWLFNNRLQYQNRLRAPDYRRMIEGAGFRVVAEEAQRGKADDLAAVSLAPQFRHYGRDELLILRTWITAVA